MNGSTRKAKRKTKEKEKQNDSMIKWFHRILEAMRRKTQKIEPRNIGKAALYISLIVELAEFSQQPTPDNAVKIMIKFMALYGTKKGKESNS